MHSASRRGFLGAIATAPALALPTIAAQAVPALSAEARAKAAYTAFALAMDEVVGAHAADGWLLMCGRRDGFGTLPPARYATASIVELCGSDDPRLPNLVFERQKYLYELKLV